MLQALYIRLLATGHNG